MFRSISDFPQSYDSLTDGTTRVFEQPPTRTWTGRWLPDIEPSATSRGKSS